MSKAYDEAMKKLVANQAAFKAQERPQGVPQEPVFGSAFRNFAPNFEPGFLDSQAYTDAVQASPAAQSAGFTPEQIAAFEAEPFGGVSPTKVNNNRNRSKRVNQGTPAPVAPQVSPAEAMSMFGGGPAAGWEAPIANAKSYVPERQIKADASNLMSMFGGGDGAGVNW